MTVSRNKRIERRGRIGKRRGKLLRDWRTIGAMSFAFIGLNAAPVHASAAGAASAAATQVTVGTLPLLAALGLGIAAAVGAVIAFLQMTAKGKAMSGQQRVSANDEDDDQGEAYAETFEEESASAPEYEEDDPLTDYTIPITRILDSPGAALPARDSEPRLCGIVGEHAGVSYKLDRRLLIGRDAGQCGVVFPYEAGEVSRRHCTVRYVPEEKIFLLEDHGSSNGTFLASGVRLEPGKQYELRDGDRFSLSGSSHSFEVRAGG
ncbi:FHA domain-containing protein [Cohnella panacarvi]|uniref:FHA domain-containing protein n=1 Tax=Cohnella panacarvi TaxID=400776 RepID=UPI00146FA324|nr:FHA domain-containing protein [Cohnella panacarvi]